MKKLLAIFLVIVSIVLGGCNFNVYPVRDYSTQELENGLLGVELIYIINYENRCNYEVVAELSDNDVKYVTDKISQIHFVGYSPQSSDEIYGIKFCYRDDSLVFEPENIVRIDNNGVKIEGTKWFCMAKNKALRNLIDELLEKYFIKIKDKRI